MEALAYLLVHLFGWIIGWPLAQFRRWLDRQPDRDPSQLPLWHRLARLTLGILVSFAFLIPLGWLIWR